MIGMEAAKTAREEGRKAAEQGKTADDNPYDYRFESVQAYAWDQGFRERDE